MRGCWACDAAEFGGVVTRGALSKGVLVVIVVGVAKYTGII